MGERGPAPGAPSEVRTIDSPIRVPFAQYVARAAQKYSKKAISDVHQALYKQMSVSCITYDFHPTEDGRLGVIW
jgi:hypothetical protein